MSLADILRAGVALAATTVESLRVDVSQERWTGQDVSGVPTYAAMVSRRGMLEPMTRAFVAPDGRAQSITAKLTFLDAAPVTVKDRLTLPDGTRPPIVRVGAPPLTEDGTALLWEAWLGPS